MTQEQFWTSYFGSSCQNVLPAAQSYLWDPRQEKIADSFSRKQDSNQAVEVIETNFLH